MNGGVRRMGLIGAFVLAILVNVFVLAGVAWNRSGEPDSTLRLTERELYVYGGFGNRENNGVTLRLRTADVPGHWLDEGKLRSLGFEPQRYFQLVDHRRSYDKYPLPRRGYVVFEYDGPAWAMLVEAKARAVEEMRASIANGKHTVRQLKNAQEQLARLRESGSRLVPVDVSNDPETLRARYPDRGRYLIAQAQIRMFLGVPGSRGGKPVEPAVYGSIRVLINPVYVPVQFHAALRAATAGTQSTSYGYGHRGPPRYAVTLHYGRRYEPWIGDVRVLR